jgi:hypothetical protein
MSKYREHMACLLNSTRVDNNFVNQQKTAVSDFSHLQKLSPRQNPDRQIPRNGFAITKQ